MENERTCYKPPAPKMNIGLRRLRLRRRVLVLLLSVLATLGWATTGEGGHAAIPTSSPSAAASRIWYPGADRGGRFSVCGASAGGGLGGRQGGRAAAAAGRGRAAKGSSRSSAVRPAGVAFGSVTELGVVVGRAVSG